MILLVYSETDNTAYNVSSLKIGGGTSTGSHIHACIVQAQRKHANEVVDSAYEPRTCAWQSCRDASEVWQTRKDFIKHLHLHLNRVSMALTVRVSKRSCRWQTEPGVACEESGCDDWEQHFAITHAINPRKSVHVYYCCICAHW